MMVLMMILTIATMIAVSVMKDNNDDATVMVAMISLMSP